MVNVSLNKQREIQHLPYSRGCVRPVTPVQRALPMLEDPTSPPDHGLLGPKSPEEAAQPYLFHLQ